MYLFSSHRRPCETKETNEDEAISLNIPFKKILLITFLFGMKCKIVPVDAFQMKTYLTHSQKKHASHIWSLDPAH